MRTWSTAIGWEAGDTGRVTATEEDFCLIIGDGKLYLHVKRRDVQQAAHELTRLASELVSKLDDRSNNQ